MYALPIAAVVLGALSIVWFFLYKRISKYENWVLALYDFIVYKINTPFAWKAHLEDIQSVYRKNLTARHCEVGVASIKQLETGLQKFNPSQKLDFLLLDINDHPLERSEAILKGKFPTSNVQKLLHDITRPFSDDMIEGISPKRYKSVGLNFVLHCIQGPMSEKGLNVFRSLSSLLANKEEDGEDGVIFGSTILGAKVQPNWFGKYQLKNYNKVGIFHNSEDDYASLELVLHQLFQKITLYQKGLRAFFVFSKPKK
eukprot:TRINITY_DN7850_c0_g6_i1.p1 TRINITY_DN7850_c0_g6~~TRINITY_DN7850_c0_g6_i1.p1  ORF type:complete len:256 (-),score=45.09 TRINITY_DN7850_c0_g6_i1:66-833(-)